MLQQSSAYDNGQILFGGVTQLLGIPNKMNRKLLRSEEIPLLKNGRVDSPLSKGGGGFWIAHYRMIGESFGK